MRSKLLAFLIFVAPATALAESGPPPPDARRPDVPGNNPPVLDDSDDSGCSCNVGDPSVSVPWASAVISFGLLFWPWRRRR
jgi:hypothetical protein